MAIVISGVNNNDKITAADGTIDLLSGVSYASTITAPAFTATGNLTAASINVGNNIQLGNAGVATATTFVGNLNGNVNGSAGTLLLQTSGSERIRIGAQGQIGIAGANYGTSGQVLTSGGSGSSVTWSTINSDAINEGNTKAEVIDSGSDGRFIVETDGVQRISVDSNGLGITSTTTAARNAGVGTAIGTIIFNSTDNKLQLYANDLNWRGFSPADPSISNISGTIYAGTASTLSLTGNNFMQSNLQVRFLQNTRSIDVTVTVTPSSDTSASVTVPATVYNNLQANDVVSISVTNSDNVVSNTVTLTASGLPTGGNITTSGSYRIHSFTSSGTFVVPSGMTLNNVEYLIVAGGGGGGGSAQGHQGGGGGAGGLRTSVVGATSGANSSPESRVTFTAGSYNVTIGGGGVGRASGAGYGGTGVNSGLATPSGTITSNGGGGGGMGQNNGASRGGLSGGCGGGAASSDQSIPAAGSGTAGQGFLGGQPLNQGSGSGGSGGGAGGNGNDKGGSVGTGTGAVGGLGLSNSITGSAATYSVGGDCTDFDGVSNTGAANTGDGGDGGYTHTTPSGRSGGSGIVIVRYILS